MKQFMLVLFCFFIASSVQAMQGPRSGNSFGQVISYSPQIYNGYYPNDLRLSYLYPIQCFMVQLLCSNTEIKTVTKKEKNMICVPHGRRIPKDMRDNFSQSMYLKIPEEEYKKLSSFVRKQVPFSEWKKFFPLHLKKKKVQPIKREVSTETLAMMMHDMSLSDEYDVHDDREQDREDEIIDCEEFAYDEELLLDKMDDFYWKAQIFWKLFGSKKDVTFLWWEKVSPLWKWYGKELEDIDIPLIPNGFTLELIRDPRWNNDIQVAFRCSECLKLVYFKEMLSVLSKRKEKKASHKKSVCLCCLIDFKNYIYDKPWENIETTPYFDDDVHYGYSRCKNLYSEEFKRNYINVGGDLEKSLDQLIEIAKSDLIEQSAAHTFFMIESKNIVEDGIKKLCKDYWLDENFTNYHLNKKFVNDGIERLYGNTYRNQEIIEGVGIRIGDYVYPQRIVDELGKKYLENYK